MGRQAIKDFPFWKEYDESSENKKMLILEFLLDKIKMMNYIYFYKFEGITCKPTPHEIKQLI